MRLCKVIATSGIGRTVRGTTTVGGQPPRMCNHSQYFPAAPDVFSLVVKNIESESYSDLSRGSDFEIDVVLVNNSVGDSIFDALMTSFDGIQLPHGVVRVLHRENVGRSFGGYAYAFDYFKEEYDFFCFTEDDIGLTSNSLLHRAAMQLVSDNALGYIALIGQSHEAFGVRSLEMMHAHGGICITRKDVLDAVHAKYGGLPYAKDENDQSYASIIIEGEVAFTSLITKLGYKSICWDSVRGLAPGMPYVFWYDQLRGIRTDPVPSSFRLFFWFLQKARCRLRSIFYGEEFG